MTFIIDFPAFDMEIVTKLQAWYLFCICSVVFVVVSLVTPPPKPHQVERYCWKNPLAAITEKRISGFWDPRILSLLLIVVMTVCYWIFA